MNRNALIHFPRSGAGLVSWLLRAYHGTDYEIAGPDSATAATPLVVTADWDGAYNPLDRVPIVLSRDPLEAFASVFRHAVALGQVADTLGDFRTMVEGELVPAWRRFRDKWIIPGNRYRLRYEDLAAKPAAILRHLLKFQGAEVDEGRLAAVLGLANVARRGSHYADFPPYLDRTVVEWIRKMLV